MGNARKWLAITSLSFVIGAMTAWSDDHEPNLWILIRHGLMACIPGLTGLLTTLEKGGS